MHPLGAMLLAAAATCALARPPGPTVLPMPAAPQEQAGPQREMAPPPPARDILGRLLVPRFLFPHYLGYDESPRIPPATSENDWLNKEIDRISEMEAEENLMNTYDAELAGMMARNPYLQRVLDLPGFIPRPPDNYIVTIEIGKAVPRLEPYEPTLPELIRCEPKSTPVDKDNIATKNSTNFAMTPFDNEYYYKEKCLPHEVTITIKENPEESVQLEPPRQTRQNPNLSKQKHLIELDLEKLKAGLANKDYRLPVSLLPTNLRWLRIIQPTEKVVEESSLEEGEDGKQVHMLETAAADPAESMYGVALVAAVGAALTMAIVGFTLGWYTLLKRAKAAADVDYPAYGVTGPSMDSSGDRKLAHSAHMYHYQHQKQQIIAMERNGLEQRNGSVSDPESEEENEEGDYTVYECPGFATTGDMEVKNPLFSDDPTPATPGKCEVVKPQPKD